MVPLGWWNMYLVKRPKIGHKERYAICLVTCVIVWLNFLGICNLVVSWLMFCRFLAYSKSLDTLSKWFTSFEKCWMDLSIWHELSHILLQNLYIELVPEDTQMTADETQTWNKSWTIVYHRKLMIVIKWILIFENFVGTFSL